jgi:integrase/recombinase XerD
MQNSRPIQRGSLSVELALVEEEFVQYLRKRHSADRTINIYCNVLKRVALSGWKLLSIRRPGVSAILRSLRIKWTRPAQAALHGWLKFRGRFEMPRARTRWHSWIDDYLHFMEDSRGLSPVARCHYSGVAERYMAWQFQRRPVNWRYLGPEHIWRYAARIRSQGWKAKSTIDELSALRQFLRFVHLRGACSPLLAQAVPSVNERPRPIHREYLTEEQRCRLLASFDRTSAEGRRDYTMARCMIDLGLRSVEVARLRLADVDLDRGLIAVPAAKKSRERQLPLPRRVVPALRAYVRARPATTSDYFFVGHAKLVGRALSSVAIRAAMDRAYRRCGFPWYGTHRLRRSFATRLYARGANMKEIADLLGHQLVTTTERYAQVDHDGLRALVRPWPA